jgi:hypothetical protein
MIHSLVPWQVLNHYDGATGFVSAKWINFRTEILTIDRKPKVEANGGDDIPAS